MAFGVAGKRPQYEGEFSVPVDLKPGTYYLWLHIKGNPKKSGAFLWVTLGDTEHYCRLTPAYMAKPVVWEWRRVPYLRASTNPLERPMKYEVTKTPTVLRLKHRANYLAVDGAFITDSPHALPAPETWRIHVGCASLVTALPAGRH